jgi:hypothetical protein
MKTNNKSHTLPDTSNLLTRQKGFEGKNRIASKEFRIQTPVLTFANLRKSLLHRRNYTT